jgi:Family of unknown function (DUF5677)
MLDSVIIQIAECAPGPAALQLRSMFEALLTIQYITEDNSKYRQHAYAYLHQVQLGRKSFYSSQLADTQEGEYLRVFIANDPFSADWKPADPAECADRIKEIEEILKQTDFQAAAEEYRRTRKETGRKPYWYSLYGGARRISDWAKSLKRGATYAMLYKDWSDRGHSVDAIDRILVPHSSEPAARALRDATELNSAIDFAITFAIDAARCLVRHYRPAEEIAFSKWIAGEIMPVWKRLPKLFVNSSA